jgi:hypothetical protein
MFRDHIAYLGHLEAMALNEDLAQYYLWPRTPIRATLQEEIIRCVGVSDFDLSQEHSRPSQIIRFIWRLLRADLIGGNFSVLDLPCGDAVVLWQVKKTFELANCYGLDCNKGVYETHETAQREGVVLYRAFLQHVFTSDPPEPFDLAIMLNTYRGWRSADLRQHEQNLPELANYWFGKNARFTILTATDVQVDHLHNLGFLTSELGKGEHDSKMICISRSCLPELQNS